MAITIKDLGTWVKYDPDVLPPGAPTNTMFSKRVEDGMDWYKLAHNPETWDKDSLKAIAMPSIDGWIVQAVVRDPSILFPQSGQKLLLIKGHDADDPKPHKAYEQRLYNPQTQTIGDVPKRVPFSVTRAQGKIALMKAGLLEQVKAMISHDPEAQIWFEDAATWERNSVYVNNLGAALKLTTTQIDDLFFLAATFRT